MTPPTLPIDASLPEIVDALRTASAVVIHAPPGAGKTTRVPPALLDAGLAGGGQVWVLQPRRVAARTTAARMADERGGRLGDEVGYQIRFDRRLSARTRLLVMTEGVLARRLLDDPFLDGVGLVVLDEFHERRLDTDLALAMLRRVQQTVRPDLKLVVMSATLAAEPLVEYLQPCPLVRCDVPTHPVAIEYLAAADDRPLPVQAAAAVRTLCRTDGNAGHILAFLPGVREIQQTIGLLSDLDALVLPLYGDLAADQQDRVFAPADCRKVIVATNVAETSITIPGVTAVVDSGWARIAELDPALGLDRLVLKPISQAAAAQRAGRAGRTAPGRCLRLWTEASQRARPEFETPELFRVDLAGVVLQLHSWGESDVHRFPWFEPPRPDAIDRAESLLTALDAFDSRGVTQLGRMLARWPVHPRLGRLLFDAAQYGHSREGVLAAALLSERDVLLRESRPRGGPSSPSDVWDRIEVLQEFARSGRLDFTIGRLHPAGAQRVLQAAQQLERLVDSSPAPKLNGVASTEEALGRAVLAAYPDRLAKRREPRSRRAVMVGGRGVKLTEQSAVNEAELFVAIDVDAAGEEALVRLASAVEREWLPQTHLVTTVDVEFDETAGRVQARRRTRWFDLILDETPAALPTDDAVAAALAEAARRNWTRVFPPSDADAVKFIARVRCLRDWMPELQLPDWNDAALQSLLPTLCGGCRSFEELQRAPWLAVLGSTLTPAQRVAVEREAPERLQTPSGSRIPLQYEPGRPPVLAVRIQEIFGWSDTPRIAGGRVPVLLHLLAPNHRPQQITDDLRSFWTTAYPQIRGELRRRYPKHAWPEDPWTATAERHPQRKRSGQ